MGRRGVHEEYVLTDEERNFAENHHVIVLKFLSKKRLQRNKYYDIAAIGYCRAVRNWFRCEGIRDRTCFDTLAWRCMWTDVHNYQFSFSYKMRNAVVISLDGGSSRDGGAFLHEHVPGGGVDPLELICYAESLRELWHMVPDSHKDDLRAVLKVEGT